MISYLKHPQIDKVKWDLAIEKSLNGTIYAYSWYLDIVCPNWEAIVSNDYADVMPIARGEKYFIDYIFPPFFCQQLGVFSDKAIDQSMCNLFFSAIPQTYRFIEMKVNISNRWFPQDFSATRNSNFILKLQKSYDEIRKGYTENHDRNVKKSRKHDLILFQNGSADDVIKMFRENRGKDVPNLKDKHYLMLQQLVVEARARNKCKIWIVNNKYGLPIAGAVFFESHGSGIFIFSAVNSEGKACAGMHFLIDAYIQSNSLLLNTLDFEGSNDLDLARFYRGFGSTEFVYLQIKKNQLPIPWKWFKK